MFNNVDHLNYCVMVAPITDARVSQAIHGVLAQRAGGTGYLKELMASPMH
jgi:hypothetical protein